MKQIRIAEADDADRLLAIYTPIVRETFTSFEFEPPALAQFRERIVEHAGVLPWLVLQEDREFLGYAYADKHRQRWGYQWSAEVSAYVAPAHQGRGFGRALYTSLLNILRLQGYYNVYAGIALPNKSSVAFHESMGFAPIARYPNVGYKLGAWRDVGWWYLQLRQHDSSPPEEPAALAQLSDSRELETALASGLVSNRD